MRHVPEAAIPRTAGMLDHIRPRPESAHAECMVEGLLLSAIGTPAALINTYEFFYRASRDELANATARPELAIAAITHQACESGPYQDEFP
jgi:hypothetical protein